MMRASNRRRAETASCRRLLRSFKYRVQKPVQRATQQDEEAAIGRWKDDQWTVLKKRPETSNAPSSS